MVQAFMLLLTALTSTAAYLAGVRHLGLSRHRLRAAALSLLEMAGMSIVFFVANLVIGLVIVFAVRSLTSMFLSAYLLNDTFLILLSALQGVLFGCWWDKGSTDGRAR